jgi:nucleoside phosphorylase
MNACASVNRAQWHHSFAKILPARVVPEPGKEREYAEHVADAPALHESVILSDNILLRDASVLIDAANDLHQQIRAGEMEAAGCVMACTDHYPPIPWFVIRGVSDFGDDLKNDRFHSLASAAVASYAALYLRDVLDLRIWEISS